MATILLAAAGASVGAGFGGSVLGLSGAVIGRAVGASLGQMVDRRLMGSGSEPVEVGRMDRFHLMGASEGAAIAKVWGRVRLAGQVIWASPFREIAQSSKSGGRGKGGGGAAQTTVTQYSYRVSLALGLCEGEILGVGRVWADGSEIAPNSLNLRLYRGDESQLPDPLIEAHLGAGAAPAYRGLAYVVIDDLDLGPYGSRVPQLSFEVLRRAASETREGRLDLQEVIRGVALIPGTGEYALADVPVDLVAESGMEGWFDSGVVINQHSRSQQSDMRTALGQLRRELPKCSSVSLVVSWFGNDLRCGACQLRPRVEQSENNGRVMPWTAGGIDRSGAGLVPRRDGRSIYGGTPSDQSVLQAITSLRAAGQSVMFYPFVLMEQLAGNGLPDPYGAAVEQPALPWRGRITASKAPGRAGSPDGTSAIDAEVAAFFGAAKLSDFSITAGGVSYSGNPDDWGYRRFILHYAHLCKIAGGVEAFCIGSELRGLTQLRGAGHSFPSVAALRQLAADVRVVLGSGVKLSYAADWSEYFGYHAGGNVYFHLDPLWADPNIDFIGIDNYMPLSDWREGEDHADAPWGSIYNLDYLEANIAGGEGFDWYYDGPEGIAAQRRLPIADTAHQEDWVFRYKDLRNWWSRPHHNRIGGVRQASATAWVPRSKPFRFTEYGCPAIDKGTNAPNLFWDPHSSESAAPLDSTCQRDDFIQMQYYRAMHRYWSDPAHNPLAPDGRAMLDFEKSYAWCWDARPFPDFPRNVETWADGDNYFRGHWLNGRAMAQPVENVVAEICASVGMQGIKTQGLHGAVHGYLVSDVTTARAAIQPLSMAFGFDCLEREGELAFTTRAGRSDLRIERQATALGSDGAQSVELIRGGLPEITGRMRLSHVAGESNFEVTVAESLSLDPATPTTAQSELPLVMPLSQGRQIVERWRAESQTAQDQLKLRLPPSMLDAQAGTVLELEGKRYRIDRVDMNEAREVEAMRIEPHVYQGGGIEQSQPDWQSYQPPGRVLALWLDLPLLRGNEIAESPWLAVMADPWPGEIALWRGQEDHDYRFVMAMQASATIGQTLTPLPHAQSSLFERGPALMVKFHHGGLSSISEKKLLSGSNALAIGSGHPDHWEIFQVSEADLVGPQTYALRGRLRGQAGSDGLMPDHWPAGSYVVLLDDTLRQLPEGSHQRMVAQDYRIGVAREGYAAPSVIHMRQAFAGNGLRPYRVAHLKVLPLAGGLHQIRWIARSRLGDDNWEGYEVALAEAVELYSLTIRNAAGAVLRRVDVASGVYDYPAALRDSDGALAGYQVEVVQQSYAYGAGPVAEIWVGAA